MYGDIPERTLYRKLHDAIQEDYLKKTSTIVKSFILDDDFQINVNKIYITNKNKEEISPYKLPHSVLIEFGDKTLIYYELTEKGKNYIKEEDKND